MHLRVTLLMMVALVAGCGGSEEKTSPKTTPVEETTAPRETTEATTAPEFSVGRSSEDEEDDRDMVARSPEVTPEPAPQEEQSELQPKAQPGPQPKAQPGPQSKDEEAASPEPAQAECRFFTQSEFAQASPEQRAFIQECDRAAGRTGVAPAPSPTPAAPPEPQPRPSAPTSGDVKCGDFAGSSAAAQPYLLPGDPYDLDRDNDGIACD
jgi:hypothetical protein